jgi:hypothetical protein
LALFGLLARAPSSRSRGRAVPCLTRLHVRQLEPPMPVPVDRRLAP